MSNKRQIPHVATEVVENFRKVGFVAELCVKPPQNLRPRFNQDQFFSELFDQAYRSKMILGVIGAVNDEDGLIGKKKNFVVLLSDLRNVEKLNKLFKACVQEQVPDAPAVQFHWNDRVKFDEKVPVLSA